MRALVEGFLTDTGCGQKSGQRVHIRFPTDRALQRKFRQVYVCKSL
jgi:hypothetical protein